MHTVKLPRRYRPPKRKQKMTVQKALSVLTKSQLKIIEEEFDAHPSTILRSPKQDGQLARERVAKLLGIKRVYISEPGTGKSWMYKRNRPAKVQGKAKHSSKIKI